MKGLKAIQSSASSKSRLRVKQIVGMPPPVMVSPPEVIDGFWVESSTGFGYPTLAVAPGMTLSAWLGEWNDTGGATDVEGQFVLDFVGAPDDGFPVGNVDATQLVVTSDMLGKLIYYRVRASRGAITVDEFSMVPIHVMAASSTLAQFSDTWSPDRVTVWQPGHAIPRPVYQWRVDPVFGTYTTQGSWWKNGVNTGVTTATYADTQEGDVVIWIESLVSQFGITAVMPNAFKTASVAEGSWLKNRVYKKLAEVSSLSKAALASRAAVSPHGAAGMEVFSVKDPASGTYVVNENNWLRDLYTQLCAVPAGFHTGNPTGRAWQVGGGWGSSYGNTLITPRHVVTSGHTQTTACHGGPRDWRVIRWVLEDNSIVEARIVAGSTYKDMGIGGCHDFPEYGIHIGLLDRDVQALGVPVMPIINMTQITAGITHLYVQPDSFYRCQSAADRFGPHQIESYKNYSMRWQQGRTVFAVAEDYPILHENMFWSSKYPGFRYYYFGGDSGTPNMVALNDTVFLRDILSGGDLSTDYGCGVADNLIAICDARGVALGVLSAPTGYTVTRCYDPANPRLFLLDEQNPEAILVSPEDPTPLFDLPL